MYAKVFFLKKKKKKKKKERFFIGFVSCLSFNNFNPILGQNIFK